MPTRTCPACTSEISVSGPLESTTCPYCGRESPGESVDCLACGHTNPAGADFCQQCEEPLSSVSRILSRHRRIGSPEWLEKARSRANYIKQTEEKASQERLEVFHRIEQERAAAEAELVLEKRRQEKRIILITISLAAAIVVFTIIYALVRLI